MNMGTKSLLFGAHQFIIHPYFVAKAWTQLYGWTWDPRHWMAFCIHDWGYWGRVNMDDEDGEKHVELAAHIMHRLFGRKWYWFCLCHSRYYAASKNMPLSRLCMADKMSINLTPAWLYIPLARMTGEIRQYQQQARNGKYTASNVNLSSDQAWFASVKEKQEAWLKEHLGQEEKSFG
jgi:hypothetical protein